MAKTHLDWANWIRGSFGKRSATRRRPAMYSTLSCLEQLEDRALLSAASSMSSGRWTVNADLDAAQYSETIVVEQSPNDPKRLRVVINGEMLDERLARRVKSITVNAGQGNDTVTVQLPSELSRIVVTINGGAGDDTLNAGTNRAILNGGEGNDILNGSAANDMLFGGNGDDILNGNGGDDLLQGDADSDTLVGGLGSDQMRGGAGQDWIYSSLGVDTVFTDDDDVVTAEQAVGVQNFATEAAFIDWLSHTDFVNQKLGYGSIMTAGAGPLVDVVRAESSPSGSPTSHSDTNTQVAGVDEQDIVETDGDYIYVIRGDELLIIDVREPAESNIVSRTQLTGWGSEMYLDGDHLTVISSANRFWLYEPVAFANETTIAADDTAGLRFAPPWWNWRPQTQVTTFDLSDRSQPKVVEDTVLDGTVTTSRSVDGRIYLVVNNSLWLRPPYYYDVATSIDINPALVKTSSAAFVPVISDWSKSLPQFTTRSYDADGNVTVRTGSLLDAPNIWTTDDPLQNANLLSIAMFDIHHGDAGIDSSSTVFGLSGEIYSSDDALYVAAQNWNYSIFPTVSSVFSSGPSTSIYKFDLTEEGSKLVATGKVDGTIINQFAMDEHDGYFRIATTTNTWQANRSSNVFVLQQVGDDLVTVSSLTGLSPTEQIQSARFIGDHLYMSTFLRVDPLLNIDLSDPIKPVVAGELEVPGFSTYLQQWGDHFLVSIGQDADPNTGIVTGLQLSLFDISGDAPVLVDTFKLSVTAWDTYSQAQWNHHAFSLFDEAGILAIPVSRWDSNSGYSSKLDVFQLDAVDGFKLLGAVEHDSEVLRSLRIGDQLFSLSDSTLKINPLTDPATEIAEVVLENPHPIPQPTPDPLPYPIIVDPIVIDPVVSVTNAV